MFNLGVAMYFASKVNYDVWKQGWQLSPSYQIRGTII